MLTPLRIQIHPNVQLNKKQTDIQGKEDKYHEKKNMSNHNHCG